MDNVLPNEEDAEVLSSTQMCHNFLRYAHFLLETGELQFPVLGPRSNILYIGLIELNREHC